MTPEETKKGLTELWSKYYKGSKSYLDLLAEIYYHEDMTAIHIEDGKIVAAILGIPYQFGHGSGALNGLFLCGVVTEEKYRHKGIMTRLLDEINRKAKNRDFDFTFLIPVSDLNADFFRRRGFFNSFFLLEERYTSVHNFHNDFDYSLFYSDDRIKNLKIKLYESIKVDIFDGKGNVTSDEIINFIRHQEVKPGSSVNIRHTEEDLSLQIRKCLLQEDNIFIATDEENELRGVAFVEKREMKRLWVNALFVEDNCTYYSLLSHIKNHYADYSMSVFSRPDKYSTQAIMEETYGAQNPDGGDLDTLFGLLEKQVDISKLLDPHGMVHFLKFEGVFEYLASNRKETDFKLCIRKAEKEEKEKDDVFVIKNGQMKIEEIGKSVLDNDRNIMKLSVKELSEILLRKKDTSSLIMEAFGIPRLTLDMNLVPK